MDMSYACLCGLSHCRLCSCKQKASTAKHDLRAACLHMHVCAYTSRLTGTECSATLTCCMKPCCAWAVCLRCYPRQTLWEGSMKTAWCCTWRTCVRGFWTSARRTEPRMSSHASCGGGCMRASMVSAGARPRPEVHPCRGRPPASRCTLKSCKVVQ
eukprot:365535-Chlamydomonas_euryale.AAC.101